MQLSILPCMTFDGICHCASGVRKETNGSQQSGNGDEMQDEIKDDPSYQRAVTGKPPADPSKEMLTLQGTIGMPGNIRALRMRYIPGLLKLNNARKESLKQSRLQHPRRHDFSNRVICPPESQPVHGCSSHSLKHGEYCMTCFDTK